MLNVAVSLLALSKISNSNTINVSIYIYIVIRHDVMSMNEMQFGNRSELIRVAIGMSVIAHNVNILELILVAIGMSVIAHNVN
jgi:hypothetical protein